jgi:hypothetical protein
MRTLVAIACLTIILSGYLYVKDRLDDPPATLMDYYHATDGEVQKREVIKFPRFHQCKQEEERRWEITKKELHETKEDAWRARIAAGSTPIAIAHYEQRIKEADRDSSTWNCERRSIWW